MSRACVQATWDDAPHLTQAQKNELWTAIPLYQRDARTKGIPQLGSGAIYPVEENDVVIQPFQIPLWYRHAYGLDVGWNRTAAIWGAIDPEEDILYLYSEYYRSQAEPTVHAAGIKSRGIWIPGVIDPAARGRQQSDGEQLLQLYLGEGLLISEADNGVEAGLLDVWQRLSTGRLKVFATLQNWRAEFRIYRRDEKGKIVKENDHLMDATRYLVRSGVARADQQPTDKWHLMSKKRNRHEIEYDPFGNLFKTAK